MLYIETLSTPSPKTTDELTNILDTHFYPVAGNSLVVLPEYFIDGENLFDGAPIDDPRVGTLINFARQRDAHVVSGLVELTPTAKHLTGLVISPTRGIIAARRKQTPTSFELRSGIVPGQEKLGTVNLDRDLAKIAVPMCIEIFRLDSDIDDLPDDTDVLVNPRGFDLDDPKIGTLSDKWLLRNRNLAMMSKRYVVGATGSKSQPGAMAEIIDAEGDVVTLTMQPNQKQDHFADFTQLDAYRAKEYRSKTVPSF